MSTTTVAPANTSELPADAKSSRRALVGAAIGNTVEWYDWTIYALFAVYFSEQFFPSDNKIASLLATFTVFAVGFVARPAGSILLGRISDRLGRRAALSTSVLIMAGASMGIALIPNAAAIGIWAAAILIVLRIIQGLSLGGESSAVGAFLAESAPNGRRGIFTSVYPTTIMIGTLVGSCVGFFMTSFVSAEAMNSYGWRVPFLIGGLLGVVGFFIRRGVRETLDLSRAIDPHPIRTTYSKHRRSAWVTMVVIGACGLSFFGLVTGFPALAKFYGVSGHEAFAANIAALATLIVLIPLFAWMSDRYGRRRILMLGLFGMAAAAVPSVLLLSHGNAILAQLVISVPAAAAQSAMMISLIERFPSTLRGSGFGFFFAISVAIVGGTAPMISTALAGSGMLILFPIYIAAVCAIAGIIVWRMRETAFAPLVD